jgi:hypothetical protein
MAWVRKVGRHVAYLQQKTVGGNANYVKRRPAIITALGAGELVDIRVGHGAEVYEDVDRRVDPTDPSVGVYTSY